MEIHKEIIHEHHKDVIIEQQDQQNDDSSSDDVTDPNSLPSDNVKVVDNTNKNIIVKVGPPTDIKIGIGKFLKYRL